jgi:hypothetical protein
VRALLFGVAVVGIVVALRVADSRGRDVDDDDDAALPVLRHDDVMRGEPRESAHVIVCPRSNIMVQMQLHAAHTHTSSPQV